MKKTAAFLLIFTLLLSVLGFAACSAANPNYGGEEGKPSEADFDSASSDGAQSYVYDSVYRQGFTSTAENPTSYFSLDRNTAAYSLVRRQINSNLKISPDSVRIEEMINYFDYPIPSPEDGEAMNVVVNMTDCPWNENNKLLMVGIKTAEKSVEDSNGNYVVLMDVSGSMQGENRLDLAKKGVYALIDSLHEGDMFSLVTYASGSEIIVDGIECSEENKEALKSAVGELKAFGSTNGEGGLENAYEAAGKHLVVGGNNRVIMISDGDFNVGISGKTSMKEFIGEKAKSGIYLSVIGVGMGNVRDDMLETLARAGNGSYAYLDNEAEAKKVFTTELSGTLCTVAKDAKAAVTFTDNVVRYRLIGYDTKRISADEFDNEKTDAGEIGSNLSVIVLYEAETRKEFTDGDIAIAEIRYKDVTGKEETPRSKTVKIDSRTETSPSLEFASCVAEFGLILSRSEDKGCASSDNILQRLDNMNDMISSDELKKEFKELVYRFSKG